MKNEFDNSKINDGKERITMPQGVKKAGGKFPWGKCSIFIVILALIVTYSVLVARNSDSKKITEEEWVAMLSESFGTNNIDLPEDSSEEVATGRYAAITTMRVVGRNNLSYLSGKDSLSDADLITLAADYDVVNGKKMNRKLSENDAKEIIEQAKEFYYDPYNYPEYCEIEFKDEVIDNTEVTIVEYDDENGIAIVSYAAEEVTDGTPIILETEPGIYKAYTITSSKQQEEGIYSVSIEPVTDIETVVDTIDFSGTVDFSSVFAEGVLEIEDDSEASSEEAKIEPIMNAQYASIIPMGTTGAPLLLAANVTPAKFEPILLSTYSKNILSKEYWSDEAKQERQAEKEAKEAAKEAEKKAKQEEKERKKAEKQAEKEAKKEAKEDKKAINEDFLATVDLEMGGKIKATAKNDGKVSYTYSEYAKYSTTDEEGNKTSAKYEVSVNNKGKIKISPALNDFKLDVEIDEALQKKSYDDSFEWSGSAEDSLSYKVTISDLSICGSTYFQKTDWDDEKNYVDFRVSGDVEVQGDLQGKLEGKFPIFDKDFPIPVTGGIVSVGLRFYLVVTATGDIYVTYEIDNIHASVYASQKGVDVNAGVDRTNFDVTAKVKLEVGPDIEVALQVFGIDVLDPSLEARAVGSAETLANNEGYEEYEKCVQTVIAGPTVKVVFIGDDNVLNMILNQFSLSMQPSYTFIDEKHAPLRVDWHFETELDGTVKRLDGKADDVCTHVMKEDEDQDSLQDLVDKTKEDAKKKVDDEIDKKKQEAEEEIENALEEWLSKNCGGCCY